MEKEVPKRKVVFKPYSQENLQLPPLEGLIPEDHIVREVNRVLDKLEINDELENRYKGGGTSAYNPLMLLKVIIYGYCVKVYSSRKLEQGVNQDITFMWIAGMNRPDHRTINDFRKELKDTIEDIFKEVLEHMLEEKYVKLENLFVDGSKFQADARKYSYVWGKNTKRYKEKVQAKIKLLLEQIDYINENEPEPKPLTAEEVAAEIKKVREEILKTDEKEAKKKLIKAENSLEKEVEKLIKYESQEEILSGRNSYSKTDKDATFMRMKDDTLLPAYNVMLSTENQFIVNYSIHQNASDSNLFVDHMKKFEVISPRMPGNMIGDAAFGTERNYAYLERFEIGNYLKFSTFHKEQTKAHKENIYHKDNFSYSTMTDSFKCPDGRELLYKDSKFDKNNNGTLSYVRIYASTTCEGCELSKKCTKGELRTIQINSRLERYKQEARDNLHSEKGIELRKQRNVEVESVFGNIKWNYGYRRFLLRGLEKVNIEIGLLSIAHNLRKMHKMVLKGIALIHFWLFLHQKSRLLIAC